MLIAEQIKDCHIDIIDDRRRYRLWNINIVILDHGSN